MDLWSEKECVEPVIWSRSRKEGLIKVILTTISPWIKALFQRGLALGGNLEFPWLIYDMINHTQ